MDRFKALLVGELLLPTFRLNQGMSIRRFIETAEHLDLVLLAIGTGAVPYIQDGPVADERMWRTFRLPLGPNFNRFAIWVQ